MVNDVCLCEATASKGWHKTLDTLILECRSRYDEQQHGEVQCIGIINSSSLLLLMLLLLAKSLTIHGKLSFEYKSEFVDEEAFVNKELSECGSSSWDQTTSPSRSLALKVRLGIKSEHDEDMDELAVLLVEEEVVVVVVVVVAAEEVANDDEATDDLKVALLLER